MVSADEAFALACDGPAALPLVVSGSRIFVDATFPGLRGSVRLAVDTAGNADGLVLFRSAATRLGARDTGDVPRAIDVGGARLALPDGARVIFLDDVSAEAQRHPLAPRHLRKDESEGQIGAGVLSRFLLCIDPRAGRLALVDPAIVRVRDEPSSVPLAVHAWEGALYPIVELTVGGQAAPLVVDTGASTGMLETRSIAPLLAASPSLPRALAAAGDADMVAGRFLETWVRVPSVAAGNVALGDASFVERPDGTFRALFGAPIRGALANDVLFRHRVLLDYQGARLFLRPSGRPADASASSQRVGLAVGYGPDGCPLVRQVTDTNAPATRAAVSPGDVLLAVDALDACASSHAALSSALAGRPGTVRHLRLRRGAEVLLVEAVTAELLPPRDDRGKIVVPSP